jgi:FtsP/CotA-like multicopper oxidase with cupredoxin domain
MSPRFRPITSISLGALGVVPLVALATSLGSSVVPKFVDPLPVFAAMPQAAGGPAGVDYYEIAARPFSQQVLPVKDIYGNPLNATQVFGFGPNGAGTPVCDVVSGPTANCYHYPALTIAATSGQAVQVLWLNQLVDGSGPVTYPQGVRFNQNIHWANPTGQCVEGGASGQGTDCTGGGGLYTGPVPMIVHLHGAAEVSEASDGIPEAWFLPANSPGYVGFGSDYCHVNSAGARDCTPTPGQALFQYNNQQGPTTLFFHDHTLGVTQENIAMGLVGGYVIAGGPLDVPSLPSGAYDIPLVIQDKSFTTDGQLVASEEGNIMVVNGKSWPYLNVEPRRYRFRIIQGGVNQYYHLHFNRGLNFTQVGSDQGYLPNPLVRGTLTIAPGERMSVVVDFTGQQGRSFTLQTDSIPVLRINVNVPLQGTDTTSVPAALPHKTLSGPPATTVANVALFDSLLGTGDPTTAVPMRWDDPTTEFPQIGTVQEWDIYNAASQDSHPIHLHEAQFQVLGRTSLNSSGPCPPPAGCGPRPGESGLKDTVIADQGQVTRILVDFTQVHRGLFAWHCHITPHEDEEMMRPMCIIDPTRPPANPTLDGFAGCPSD